MDLTPTFENLSLATLDGYLTHGQEENLHLEFKRIAGSDFNARDDKRNFACAISGFSNVSGGIILWGIDAKKNDKK